MPFVPVDSIPSWNSLFVATEGHALRCYPFVEANVSLLEGSEPTVFSLLLHDYQKEREEQANKEG